MDPNIVKRHDIIYENDVVNLFSPSDNEFIFWIDKPNKTLQVLLHGKCLIYIRNPMVEDIFELDFTVYTNRANQNGVKIKVNPIDSTNTKIPLG